jgi:phage baseplate assembly protein gpV
VPAVTAPNADTPPPPRLATTFGPGDIVPETYYDPAKAVLTLTVTNTKPPSAAGLTVSNSVTVSGTNPDGSAFSFDTNAAFFTVQGLDNRYSGTVTVKLPPGRRPAMPIVVTLAGGAAVAGASGVQVNGSVWIKVPVIGLDGGQTQSFSIPLVPLPGDTAVSIVAPAAAGG